MEVFVLEQRIPVQMEIDEYDNEADHFLMIDNGIPIATARLFICKDTAKLGRIAVKKECRNKGYGTILCKNIIKYAQDKNCQRIELDAQLQGISFYTKMGFVSEGSPFEDAGIMHIRMNIQNEVTNLCST